MYDHFKDQYNPSVSSHQQMVYWFTEIQVASEPSPEDTMDIHCSVADELDQDLAGYIYMGRMWSGAPVFAKQPKDVK